MYGFTAGQEGHILARHNAGNNTLVTMAACHLIAFRNLTLLGNVYTNLLVYARRQLVAVFAAKHLNANDFTSFAMGYTQGAVAYFASLFTKDSTQQAFFSGELGFTLRSNLAYQNIARAYFSTNADNAALIQILQCVVAYIGQLASNFFFTQLGVAGIAIIFFNMDRSKDISLYQILIQQNGVLVVIAFPGHISNDYVVA